jgi:hypothetical protein
VFRSTETELPAWFVTITSGLLSPFMSPTATENPLALPKLVRSGKLAAKLRAAPPPPEQPHQKGLVGGIAAAAGDRHRNVRFGRAGRDYN